MNATASRLARTAGLPVGTVLCAALLFVLSGYQLYNLTLVASFAISVLGLNLLLGRLGVVSAGHGALMGVGGYGTTLLFTKVGLPYGVALLAATGITVAAGVVVGLPALRIRGLSLGLVTLGLAILFPELITHFASVTGGPNGLPSFPIDAPSWLDLTGAQWMYLLAVVLLAVALAAYWLLTTSAFGRGLDLIRVSEDLARASGVAPGQTSLAVFAISAGFAGLGGGLYQLTLGTATPDTYSFTLSLTLVFASVLGGMRFGLGAILGSAFIVYVPNYTAGLGNDGPQLIYAALLLLVVYGVRLVGAFRQGRLTRALPIRTRRPAAPDSDSATPVAASTRAPT